MTIAKMVAAWPFAIGTRSRKERLAVSKQNGTIKTMLIMMRISSAIFLQIGYFQGALLQMMIGSKVYSKTIIRKFTVVLLQIPFPPSEKVAQGLGFGSQSLLLQQQQQAPICPALRMSELAQKTKWFYTPMKLELGRNFESCLAGLLRAKKRVIRRTVTKFLQIQCIDVIQPTSLVKSIVVVIVMKLTMPQYCVISTICLSVFLLSHRIQTICDRSLMAKAALQTASLLLIPMPISASLMAMRSLAPSPTIPTFNEHSPNSFFQQVLSFILAAIISLCLRTINALFSGVILAKTFTLLSRKVSGLFLMKSLSMANTAVPSSLLKLNLSICLWLSVISPLGSLASSVTSTLCPRNLAPSKTTTLNPVEIMPVMRAVCTPRKMLSPVIILVLISLSVRASMVLCASSFSKFTKVTRPSISILFKKAYLSSLRRDAAYFYVNSRDPKAILLKPSSDSFLMKASYPFTLVCEYAWIISGLPFPTTKQRLFCLQRTDIDWNLDSYSLILSTSIMRSATCMQRMRPFVCAGVGTICAQI